MKNHKKNRAFTLIEMLGVLAIVALLLSISTISFRHSQAKARDVVRKTDLQMIADALISYANDHGHFPSSIYDNWQALTIPQALNMVADGWYYKASWLEMLFYPDEEILKNILWISPTENMDPEYFESTTIWSTDIWTMGWSYSRVIYRLKDSITNNDTFDSISSIIEDAEKDAPIATNLKPGKRNMNYSIVTQWMCASRLKEYLVDEWYISTIPSDPSWESVNLQTNICADPDAIKKWINANDPWRSIQWWWECQASTNLWCTKLCQEWYMYVSDWIHFALIAHMESENWWNYETAACGLCKVNCVGGEDKLSHTWTKTDQLPCDIMDEFRNTYDCIKENWVVEYSTWEYYFYIY